MAAAPRNRWISFGLPALFIAVTVATVYLASPEWLREPLASFTGGFLATWFATLSARRRTQRRISSYFARRAAIVQTAEQKRRSRLAQAAVFAVLSAAWLIMMLVKPSMANYSWTFRLLLCGLPATLSFIAAVYLYRTARKGR
jgi:hypothetical protein